MPSTVSTKGVEAPEIVEAEVFHKEMEGGRNKAALVSARTSGGELVECVVKMAAGLNNPASAPEPYLFEWVAAALAARLGILAARPYQVVITKEFAESIKSAKFKDIALASLGKTFGSRFQAAPFTQLPAQMSPEQRGAAELLLAFDIYVHNYDRRHGNPNVLVSRDRLFAFDHGEAFSFLYVLFRNHETDPLLEVLEKHALCTKQWLRCGRCNLAEFRVRLAGLTDEVFTTIVEATPPEWQVGQAEGKLTRIVEVLRRRRDAVEEWLPKVEAWLGQ